MKMPEKGFYYHYKHDPNGAFNNYAYEVMGTARHTELQNPEIDKFVIYRPLRESAFYEDGKYWGARPLDMFTESIEKDGVVVPRFRKITDPEIIEKLEKVRDEMYK